MKNNIYLILTVLIIILTSCSKDYLETGPSTSLGDQFVETSEEGLSGILDGMHHMMYTYSFGQYMGSGQAAIGAQLDFLADDVINTKPAYHMSNYRWDDHTDIYGSINYKTWDFYYTMILHANKIIEGVNKNKELFTDNAKNSLLGEAHAFRAWAYHNLVQLFGKRYVKGTDNSQLGVIIRKEGQYMETLGRSTVGEVYDYIDENMSMALELLEKAPDKGIKNTIRYSTACGIAARIALTKEDWENAEKYAGEAISESGASLQTETLLDGFNDMSASEWMWGYKQSETQNLYYDGFFAVYSCNFGGKKVTGFKFAVNRSIYDKMGPKDVRRGLWICLDEGDKIPDFVNMDLFRGGLSADKAKWEITGQPVKYRSKNPSTSFGDMLIMRLAEMYYIKAEAQARSGKYGDAQYTLNTIMVTRDPDYSTTAEGDELIEEVMRNKRIDLWMEGQRFFDIKRLKIVVHRLDAANFKYLDGKNLANGKKRNSGKYVEKIATTVDSKYWEFLIPYDEIKGNNKCEQNPL